MKLSNVVKSALHVAIFGVLVLCLASTSAVAATATTTFGVSATVQATCLVSATPMAFGTYTGVVATSTSTVSVTCTNTTPYNVLLSAGLGTGATVTARKMMSGAATLNYGLYRDAAWTQNWGITTGTDTVAGTGNGSSQAITVYGQAAASQYVTPGAYSDTITATINY